MSDVEMSDATLTPTTIAQLPSALLAHILLRVPVADRLRCAEVCRAWRDACRERALWHCLDLSWQGCRRAVSAALLAAAVARAGGELRELDVSGRMPLRFERLRDVVAANGASLTALRMHASFLSPLSVENAEALLQAAPSLRVLQADVSVESLAQARATLRKEAPFAPLRVHRLTLSVADENELAACAPDLAAHDGLAELHVDPVELRTPAVLDAVVDAAVQSRLTSFAFNGCFWEPATAASAPALQRLLSCDSLTSLQFRNSALSLVDEPAAAMLGSALRASRITSLHLVAIDLWETPGVVAQLLGALAGHSRVRMLDVSFNRLATDDACRCAAAMFLGAIVAANAPALRKLRATQCDLGEEVLGPVFNALPFNTHLQLLDVSDNNALAPAFWNGTLLPAMHANTSLTELRLGTQHAGHSEAHDGFVAQVNAFYAARTAAAEANDDVPDDA